MPRKTRPTQVPPRVRRAINSILNYNWVDELEDFRDHEQETDCHIFTALVTVDNWLHGTEAKPAGFLK